MTTQRDGVKYHLVPGICHNCSFFNLEEDCPYYIHGKWSGFLKCCYDKRGAVRSGLIWRPLTEPVKDV